MIATNQINEMISNADIAFENQQFETALEWYKKAAEAEPDNLYAVSQAGAAALAAEKLEDALHFLSIAKSLDSQNGDCAYNLGNALLLNDKYGEAFKQYVEAERLGCSDENMPRLYFQLAMLCSAKQDFKGALVYFDKSEESDKDGLISTSPDFISEKLKIFMYTEDVDKAEEFASQLVAVDSGEFSNYIVYFNILMSRGKFDVAERILDDAEKYADLDGSHHIEYIVQKVAFHIANAKYSDKELSEILKPAKELIKAGLEDPVCDKDGTAQLLMSLSEIYSAIGDFDGALKVLKKILRLEESSVSSNIPRAETDGDDVSDLTSEELEEMLKRDIEEINQKVYYGEINPANTRTEYDEEGNPYTIYKDLVNEEIKAEEVSEEPSENETFTLNLDFKENVYFAILNCYIEKDEFESVEKLASILKLSENTYYSYFGLYAETLAVSKTESDSEKIERKIAEAVSFFRNRSFENSGDILAAIFRARLYADQGKYDKAIEISNLLAESDKEEILEYVNKCKSL